MPSLPLNLAMLVGPGVILVMVAIYAAAWAQSRSHSYLILFAFGYLSFVLAVLSQALFWPPDPDLNEMVSAGFYTISMMSVIEALLRRSGQRGGWLFHGAMFGILMGLIAYFTYFEPSLRNRIYSINIGVGTGLVICLTRVTDLLKRRPFDKILFWVFAVFALHFFPRTVLTVNADVSNGIQPFTNSTFWTVMHICVTALAAALATAFLAATVADILDDLKGRSERDKITGLLDQRGFARNATALLTQESWTATIILGGIDDLPRFNEQFGHNSGDDFLRAFAYIISTKLQDGDVMGRLDSGEFAVLLSHRDEARGRTFSEHVRDDAMLVWSSERGKSAPSVSFGIAERRGDEDIWGMLAKANESLADARRTARNKSVISNLLSPVNSNDDGEHDFRF